MHRRSTEWSRLARRRWVGAGDATVGHVFGPFATRPVPLFVPAEGVREPARSDAGERRIPRSRRPGRRPSRASPGAGAGEGAPRGRCSAAGPPASLRREGPHGEHGTEDHEDDPRTVSVVHGSIVGPVAGPGRSAPASRNLGSAAEPSLVVPAAGRLPRPGRRGTVRRSRRSSRPVDSTTRHVGMIRDQWCSRGASFRAEPVLRRVRRRGASC